jgi:hypothetical protein
LFGFMRFLSFLIFQIAIFSYLMDVGQVFGNRLLLIFSHLFFGQICPLS